MADLLFTLADAERAHAEWGCNCGPAAFAAIAGCTLEETRGAMRGFEGKGYTNPMLMLDALARASVRFTVVPTPAGCKTFPAYGLARIQWEGPWTDPSVRNKGWKLRRTHWVGSMVRAGHVGIFDINAMANGTGWCSLEDWERGIVPYLVALHARATGGWHITHAIEVKRLADDLRMAG